MNIYKTKSGTYINMDRVIFIYTDHGFSPELHVIVRLDTGEEREFVNDIARAFLEYLDDHLVGVYAGAA